MSNQSASDLIMGGGAPSAKFPTPGTVVKGEVLDTATSQQRTYVPGGGVGELMFWKDGSPRMQAVITVQTNERDPEIADDDGKRRIFVSSRYMKEAVRDAVTAAGKRVLEVGGILTVGYTGDGETEGTANPPKIYKAKYEPPTAPAVDQFEEPF